MTIYIIGIAALIAIIAGIGFRKSRAEKTIVPTHEMLRRDTKVKAKFESDEYLMGCIREQCINEFLKHNHGRSMSTKGYRELCARIKEEQKKAFGKGSRHKK